MKYLKHFKIFESSKLKYYDIILPPKSKKECVDILLKDFEKQGSDAKMFDTDGNPLTQKDLKSGKLKKFINSLPLKILQHEVIHIKQTQMYPDMTSATKKVNFDKIFSNDNEHKKYLSLPTEIMAYAFSHAVNDKSIDEELKDKSEFIKKPIYDKYKEIGCEVFKLYKYYIKEYQKRFK
jgi:hypothetical protein